MIKQNIFALLVGIDDYPIGVPKLKGCRLDVDRMENYLATQFENPHIRTLVNREAKRQNLIDGFREHLAQAEKGDAILFYFAGHGSHQPTAIEFQEFFTNGNEETLVCFDSRSVNGKDLVDKELAVLFHELEATEAHIIAIFDCCHSGGITRKTDKMSGIARMAPPNEELRDLGEYLDGYYLTQLREQGKIYIPDASLIKISACQDDQSAYETPGSGGIFSHYLFQALEEVRGEISYAKLFRKTRRRVLTQGEKQIPQFRAQGSFDAYSKFLTGTEFDDRDSYSIYCERDMWWIDLGSMDGISTESGAIFLYESSPNNTHELRTMSVGPERSTIEIGSLDLDGDREYNVGLVNFIPPSYSFSFQGRDQVKEDLIRMFDADTLFQIDLIPEVDSAKYSISVSGERTSIVNTDNGQTAFECIEGSDKELPAMLFQAIRKVVRWEQGKKMRNHKAFVNPQLIDFRLSATGIPEKEGGSLEEENHLFSISAPEGVKGFQKIKIQVRNQTGNPLHFCLLYYCRKFGIHVVQNECIQSDDAYTTFYGNHPSHGFSLPGHLNKVDDFLQLIVSKEKVDDFLLEQAPFALDDLKNRDMNIIGTRIQLVDHWMVFSKAITLVRKPT